MARQQSSSRSLRRGNSVLINDKVYKRVNSTKMANSTKKLIASGEIANQRSDNFFKKEILKQS